MPVINIKTIPHPGLLKEARGLVQNPAEGSTRVVQEMWINSSVPSFFCQQELRLQKVSGLNLFLRLGTKEYVDHLEGKVRRL